MANINVSIIQAIGVVVVPPVYLDSTIERSDKQLKSYIDNQQSLLESEIVPYDNKPSL